MCRRWTNNSTADSGQSLIETALVLPILLSLVFNALNLGYFFLAMLNMSSAPRVAVEYSIQGGQTPTMPTVPSAGPTTTTSSVSYLAVESLNQSMGFSSAPIRVCTKANGTTTTNSVTYSVCTTYNGGDTFGFGDATTYSDPEQPYFIMHRVDVGYTVTPLIQGAFFNIILPSSMAFQRSVMMRAMD